LPGAVYSAIFEKKVMEINTLFEQAVADSKTLPERPSNNILLQLYAFYKQSTAGDVNIDSPDDPFDFVANAKFNAWKGLKGKTKEIAMQEYIDLVTKLKG